MTDKGVELTLWPSKKGPVKIVDMQHYHLNAAICYVERKASYAIKQLLFLSGIVHVDFVSMVPSEKDLRVLIAPQYAALVEERDRRTKELREHVANGCDDHKCILCGGEELLKTEALCV